MANEAMAIAESRPLAHAQLSLLGGFEVAGDSPAQPPLTRKARAMLAYLALQSGHSQSREKLAALLWGGNQDLQARTSLRQVLSAVRRAMPSTNGGRLLTEGDNVILNLDDVVFDVVRFEELAAQATPEPLEQAIALYRGDLLDGFSLREEPFEEWLRVERERLRGIAIEVLEKLIAHYSSANDFGRCAQVATRLLGLDPLREDIHRALMRAYAAQDRLGLALKQYQICRDASQRDLGLQPEPETQALFEELRTRRMKPGKASPTEQETASPPHSSSSPGTQAAVRRQRKLTPLFDIEPPLPTKPSVAILPFENNGGEADQVYFANGITEDIITGLTKFHDLFVIGLRSSLAVHELSTDVREIGRRLGVAHIVEGSVRKAGGRVRVTARLVEAATGRQFWAEQYDRSLDDIFVVQDEITDLIVTTLAGRIEQATRQRAADKPAKDMAAYDHLLRAREHGRHRTREGELAARFHLDRALELDPKCPAAYACYALSYIHEYESVWCRDRRGSLDNAFQLGRRAVALDETDAYTHHALAYAAHYCDQGALARREINRAILLNPYDSSHLGIRAWILLFLGHPAEALQDMNEALRLNPLKPESCLITVGLAEYMAALYRDSTETFAKMSGWDSLRYACLAACHAQLGHQEKAHECATKVLVAAAAEFGGNGRDPLECWRDYIEAMFRFQRPDDLARFADGLHKAGLPFDASFLESSRSSRMQAAARRQLELRPPFDVDPALPAKPSVAILPFENNSGDADQAYFANGITENIITGLTKFHDLFVIGLKSSLAAYEISIDVREIGRRLGVAHIVQGSVRKAGNRVRVAVQLVEAATARQLWAEQYDRCLDDIFAVQDEITDLIVTTLAGRIEQATRQRGAEKPATDMVAYDHLLRAREHSRHRAQEGELAARAHLDRALELDPECAATYACYALSYIHEYESAWCQDRRGALDNAYRLARKAVALDATDAYTHQALAYAAIYCDQGEVARKEIDRAILLNPHDYPNLCLRAWISMFLGQPDEALSDLNEALRLNPIATEMCLITVGIAEYMAALYRESSETLAKMSTWDPLRYACIAACHAQLGQPDLARTNATKVLNAAALEFGGDAGDALDRWQAYVSAVLRFQRPDDLARFADGLRKAGLPFEAVTPA